MLEKISLQALNLVLKKLNSFVFFVCSVSFPSFFLVSLIISYLLPLADHISHCSILNPLPINPCTNWLKVRNLKYSNFLKQQPNTKHPKILQALEVKYLTCMQFVTSSRRSAMGRCLMRSYPCLSLLTNALVVYPREGYCGDGDRAVKIGTNLRDQLDPVVDRVGNIIRRMNHYPEQKSWQNKLHYPPDSACPLDSVIQSLINQ